MFTIDKGKKKQTTINCKRSMNSSNNNLEINSSIDPKTPKEMIPKFKIKHWNEMNLQVEMQSICLYLLSHHSKITVGKPNRYSCLTKQFLKIKEIEFNRFDIINVLAFTKERTSQKVEMECLRNNVNLKTAFRRLQPLKKKIVMNLLIDPLKEFDYFFEFEKETNSGYEGKVRIYKGNTLLLETNEIKEKGEQYNLKIITHLSKSSSLTLTPLFFVEN